MKLRRVLFILGVLTAAYALAQSGGSFDAVDGVVSSFDASGRKTVGSAGKWIFGFLPLILFVGGIFGGMKYAKKQAEHDQDSTKVYITATIAAVAGAIVGIVVDALLGAALLGDASKGLEVLRKFWSELLLG